VYSSQLAQRASLPRARSIPGTTSDDTVAPPFVLCVASRAPVQGLPPMMAMRATGLRRANCRDVKARMSVPQSNVSHHPRQPHRAPPAPDCARECQKGWGKPGRCSGTRRVHVRPCVHGYVPYTASTGSIGSQGCGLGGSGRFPFARNCLVYVFPAVLYSRTRSVDSMQPRLPPRPHRRHNPGARAMPSGGRMMGVSAGGSARRAHL
jgi:hypothetical protein